MVKKRNIILVYVWWIVTFGIYGLYWAVKTKGEINSQGARIPTAWLLIIPIINIFWLFKYAEGYVKFVRKDDNTLLWFLLFFFISFIMPAIVQSDLNRIAKQEKSPVTS